MTTTTYSFSDTKIVFTFPGFPPYVINGTGVGEVNVSFINDNTAHDNAADGSTMVSKIIANNANVTVSVQQTSPLTIWLQNAFNALYAGTTDVWAAGQISISSAKGLFEDLTLNGVSFTKRADKPFQAQGQMVTWGLMAATVNSLGSAATQVATSVVARIVT